MEHEVLHICVLDIFLGEDRMKKVICFFVTLAMIIGMVTIFPEIELKAGNGELISFEVEYKQTEARKMAEMLNDYRASAGVYPDSKKALIYDYDMEKVAMQRAAEIAIKFDEEHIRPDGGDYTETLTEYGFNVARRGPMYGENILFGTDDTMTLEKAFERFKNDEKTNDTMLGYFNVVGIGHIKIDEKTDFWVQVFSTQMMNDEYVAPVDGMKEVTISVSASLVSDLSVEYTSGEHTVASGATVQVPVYTPKVKFNGSELKNELILSPLVFESQDAYVSASNGTMTGLQEGTGTISATLLGRTFSYNVTVTKGSGIVPTPTNEVTPVVTVSPTNIPTVIPTTTPTTTPVITDAPTTTPTPSPKPTQSPSGLKKGDKFSNNNIKYRVISTSKVAVIGLDTSKTTSITIPASVKVSGTTYKVTKIESGAFSGSSKLKIVKIGKNVTSIGNKAFYGCKALTDITIGAKVKSIGKNAFNGCSSLNRMTFSGTKLKSVGAGSLKKINSKTTIYVPSSVLKKYKGIFEKAGIPKGVNITKK